MSLEAMGVAQIESPSWHLIVERIVAVLDQIILVVEDVFHDERGGVAFPEEGEVGPGADCRRACRRLDAPSCGAFSLFPLVCVAVPPVESARSSL